MNTQTVEMLGRLQRAGISAEDALALRRISMTLQRWFELECGDGNDYGSWCITRGHKKEKWVTEQDSSVGKWVPEFTHDDDGKPYLEHHHYLHGKGKDYVTYSQLPDRETGARKRLAKILERYPDKLAYVQTDPRGASLYIIDKERLGDRDVSSCYSSFGIAVYK